VVDTHCDTLLSVTKGTRRLGERSEQGHLDLPRMREGGVDAQVFAGYVGGAKARRPLVRFLQMVDTLYRELEANTGELILATSAEDIEAAAAEGRLAAILGMEGAEPLKGDLAVLRMLHRLGVRNVGLVWGGRNRVGSGVSGKGCDDEGLSDFGQDLIRELNRLGIVVDVSHLNDAGFWDVMSMAEKPVIASHSNCRALCDHPRNLSDEQIVALAETGGTVHAVFTFLGPDRDKYTVDDVLDHIDHVVELVGPDHAGIGSDFDGMPGTPKGLEDVSRMGNLTEGLLARGYGEENVRKILGGNFLRVFREVVGR